MTSFVLHFRTYEYLNIYINDSQVNNLVNEMNQASWQWADFIDLVTHRVTLYSGALSVTAPNSTYQQWNTFFDYTLALTDSDLAKVSYVLNTVQTSTLNIPLVAPYIFTFTDATDNQIYTHD